jgi:mRNA interferase MazF
MSCLRNDVVLLPIPFTDLTSRKVRPAVVVGSNGSDLFLVPVTSQIQKADVVFGEWRTAGLNVPCGIKAQIATIQEKLVLKIVGTLAPTDQRLLEKRIRSWLHL